MKKILVFFICVLIVGLCIMSYAVGYNEGRDAAIKNAAPFIVELPELGDDYFQVFVDFGIDGVHEYTGMIC